MWIVEELARLGDRVRCRVTGYTGIVKSITSYLNGCDRVSIQAPSKEDGTIPKDLYVDIMQVEVLTTQVVPESDDKSTGGSADPLPDFPHEKR